jgi:hypothetical protein
MTPEIMKEASLMIAKYGKDEAIEECESNARIWQQDIEGLKVYDYDTVSKLEARINFWFSVASRIKEMV